MHPYMSAVCEISRPYSVPTTGVFTVHFFSNCLILTLYTTSWTVCLFGKTIIYCSNFGRIFEQSVSSVHQLSHVAPMILELLSTPQHVV